MQGVLAGRYRLERQLGKGGMGSVWLAEHLALRSWVAVKLMDPAIAATPEGAERFRREAQAAASLRSAHVVQVLDYGLHETTPYLVMELMQGESLASCLEREKRLTPERTAAIITQVARALSRAHAADIVHRDLKPDNIFLVREDDQELVKILDFGIAKTPSSQFGGMETRTGVTMGTPYYMSPEQVEGKKAVDFRTDLWALAVIANECMTGVRPFDGSTFGELLLNICARPIPAPSSQGLQLAGFDAWFAKATNRDPEQRFGSAQELASSLKDVVAGRAPETPVFVPAATAGPAPTAHWAGPSVSSINTAQAIDGLVPRRASPLPWVLLVLALLGTAVAGTVLFLRSKASDAAAEDAARAAATPAQPAPSQGVALAPTTPTSNPSDSSAKPVANKRPTADTHKESAAPTPIPASPPPATTEPAAHKPSPANTGNAPTATCFSDPFSGQIRPTGASRPANAPTFGCRQDPFTGKYKKL